MLVGEKSVKDNNAKGPTPKHPTAAAATFIIVLVEMSEKSFPEGIVYFSD